MMQKQFVSLFKPLTQLSQNDPMITNESILSYSFNLKAHGSQFKVFQLKGSFLYIQENSRENEDRLGIKLTIKHKLQIFCLNIKNSQKIIGFRISIDNFHGDQFYSEDQDILKQWIQALKKRIVMKGFNSYFRTNRKLGKGGFSILYDVERLSDKQHFAGKALLKKKFFESDQQLFLENQLRIMRQLHHKNIIQIQGIYQTQNSLYIVQNLMAGQSLQNRIDKIKAPFKQQLIKKIMKGILQGIHYLHEKQFIHRDLKPQNIMFKSQKSYQPVVIDFGLAAKLDDIQSLLCICGTFGYISPQVLELPQETSQSNQQLLKQFPIGPSCDIFAIGMIFHYLLTGKQLIECDQDYDNIYGEKKLNIDFQSYEYHCLDPRAIDLLSKLLVYSAKYRISAKQALQHSYFQ